jgi:LPXTG-motif cell wall-anchored protein
VAGHKGLIILLFLFMNVGWAVAEHEADHRYTVKGYVRDAAGKAKEATPVVVEHKGDKKSATTDARGYYEVRYHLHDANKGDAVTVTAGGEVKKISIDLIPEDHITERIGRVDFGAPGGPDWSGIAWVGGALLAVGGGYYWQRRKKRMRRETKREERRTASHVARKKK